jgi:hypothetical protein
MLALATLNRHPTIRSLQKCNGNQILWRTLAVRLEEVLRNFFPLAQFIDLTGRIR